MKGIINGWASMIFICVFRWDSARKENIDQPEHWEFCEKVMKGDG